MLTPETMRYLADNVQRVTDQIHNVFLASRSVDLRVQVQKSEFGRQQAKAREVLQSIERLRGERQEATKAKLERARDGQKALMARIDRILGAMMRNASPEVSEHERKWFEELKRMKNEVAGRGRYDQDSLVARTNLVSLPFLLPTLLYPQLAQQLRRELDRLMPSLKELRQKEETLRQKMLANGTAGLGVSQAFELGERASTEYVQISISLCLNL